MVSEYIESTLKISWFMQTLRRTKMHGSRTCILYAITALLYLFSLPMTGEAMGMDIARMRVRRDAEDEYYNPSTRMGCPPSMTRSGSGGGTEGTKEKSRIIFIVATTLGQEKTWNAQVDFLLKIRGYVNGNSVLVAMDCPSEPLVSWGKSEDKFKQKLLEKGAQTRKKKGVDDAFNKAHLFLATMSYSEEQSTKVVIFTDDLVDDCAGKSQISAYEIVKNLRAFGVKSYLIAVGKKSADMEKLVGASNVITVENFDAVDKSVYKNVAKWICMDDSTGESPGKPSGNVITSSSSSSTTSRTTSSTSTTSRTTSSTSSTTSRTTSTTSSTTSRTTTKYSPTKMSKDMLAQIPYVPGGGGKVSLVIVIDFTKSSAELFNALIDYVVHIVDLMPKARVGIVLLSCPSRTVLEMDIWAEADIRSKLVAPTEPLTEKGTAQALKLGEKLLEGETRPIKSVIIMSDGKTSTCPKEKPKEDEFSIAKTLRDLSIRLLYSIVGDNADLENIETLIGDPSLNIPLGDLIKLLETFIRFYNENNVAASKATTTRKTTTTKKSEAPSEPKPPVTSKPRRPGNMQIPFLPGAGADVSFLMVIDFTKSNEELFDAMINEVVAIAGNMPKARVGVVLISCPSQTVLKMGTYSEDDIRSKVTAPTEPLNEKGTAQALELGKQLLAGETRKNKFLFIMSDGGKSTCQKNKPNEDELDIAKNLRDLGIQIIYSLIGKKPDQDNADKFTGDPKFCIGLGDLVKLFKLVIDYVESYHHTPAVIGAPATTKKPGRSKGTSGLSCPSGMHLSDSVNSRSIMFILDSSGTITETGWEEQLDYVRGIVDLLDGARVGAVTISCRAETMLTIGDYTTSQLKRYFKRKEYVESMSDTKGAFKLAKKVLEGEISEGKAVIVLSDGEESNCHFPSRTPSEFRIAKDMRDDGISIIYVAVRGVKPINTGNIKRIVGSSGSYYKISDPFQDVLLQEFCVY